MKIIFSLLFFIISLVSRDPFHHYNAQLDQALTIKVLGVCVTDARKIAICTARGQEAVEVTLNEIIDNYRIVAIESRRVVLHDQTTGKEHEIKLTAD